VIRVASFDFPESVVLAQLYGKALRSAGFDVSLSLNLGSREMVEPALEQGFVDLVPEYLGSALQFMSLGRVAPTASFDPTRAALERAAHPRGLVAMASAPAQDQNAVVVRAVIAAKNHLLTISDLVPLAPTMTFGAPPECRTRELCLLGLERVYGLRFGRVLALDPAGTYTVASLRSGAIDAGLLFSTDGRLPAAGLVPLIDDRGLQPAENVTPIVRRAALSKAGPRLRAVLDAVSKLLTSGELTKLNQRVSVDREPAAAVAAAWLKGHGLGD
jgi:osmoprotectant transport system substrate-binding protein